MIGLGLRLVLSGGREAVTRLLVLAVAVGLGVGLLLTAVAATNAVTAWNNSHAWLWTGTVAVPAGPGGGHRPAVVAPERRHLRRPADQPLRRGRHRCLVTGAARPHP